MCESVARRLSGSGRGTWVAVVAVSLAVAASLLLGASAAAQRQPPISRAEVEEHIQRLGLTDAAEVARANEIYTRMIDAVEDLREAEQIIYRWQMPVYDQHPEQTEAYRVTTADQRLIGTWVQTEEPRLIASYFTDLRAAFSGREERAEWIERAYQRRWYLRREPKATSGSSTPDLIHLCEQVAPDAWDRPALRAHLDDFDRAIDRIVRPYRAARLGGGLLSRRSELTQAGDFDGLVAMWDAYYRPIAQIRAIAQRFRSLIAAQLTVEEAEQFHARYTELMYEFVVSPTRIDLLIENALKRDDLSRTQRDRIHALRDSLEARRFAERRRLIAQEDAIWGLDGLAQRTEEYARSALGQLPAGTQRIEMRHRDEVAAYRTIGSELEETLAAILAESGGGRS